MNFSQNFHDISQNKVDINLISVECKTGGDSGGQTPLVYAVVGKLRLQTLKAK
jgi:hypothetical protein